MRAPSYCTAARRERAWHHPPMAHDELHEEEAVELRAEGRGSGPLLRQVLREAGLELDDDVFLLRRPRREVRPWQSDAATEVEILADGAETYDADAGWDTVRLVYPLATVPADLIALFVDTASAIAARLGLPLRHRGAVVSAAELRETLTAIAATLASGPGAPGSEELAIEIAARYAR